jgi:hypothetical protein
MPLTLTSQLEIRRLSIKKALTYSEPLSTELLAPFRVVKFGFTLMYEFKVKINPKYELMYSTTRYC